jgi:hypothetical protein
MDASALQELIQLHNRTCVLASPLHTKVALEHKAGNIATVPGDTTTHMTMADFKSLRDAKRRTEPSYKLPARRHQPHPSTWELYVASDNRSGENFASVMYVDTTKIRMGPMGIEYPADSVRVDLGYIPITPIPGALCSAQMIVELVQRLDQANRLLTPVAGGWKPVAGFPYTKRHWETDKVARISQLCRELTRILTSPI